jgi:hypothetical protein
MWEWLKYNFSWYGGAVWPNIWAWIVCGIPTVIMLWKRWKSHLHNHLAAYHESMKEHIAEQIWDFLDMNGHNDHRGKDSPEFSKSTNGLEDQTESD